MGRLKSRKIESSRRHFISSPPAKEGLGEVNSCEKIPNLLLGRRREERRRIKGKAELTKRKKMMGLCLYLEMFTRGIDMLHILRDLSPVDVDCPRFTHLIIFLMCGGLPGRHSEGAQDGAHNFLGGGSKESSEGFLFRVFRDLCG
jgi:hypothetical protein